MISRLTNAVTITLILSQPRGNETGEWKGEKEVGYVSVQKA